MTLLSHIGFSLCRINFPSSAPTLNDKFTNPSSRSLNSFISPRENCLAISSYENPLAEEAFRNANCNIYVQTVLQAILEEAGVSFSNVVKTTIYVTDMSIYGKVNEVYGTYMTEPFPAREVVCVKELPLGAKVEISMVAVKP